MKKENDNQGIDSAKSIVKKTRQQLEAKGVVSPDLSKMKQVKGEFGAIIFKKHDN